MISKIIRSNSSSNLIRYIFKDHAHDTSITDERYLVCGATNVANGCYDIFDPDYAASQFWAVQQKAKNKHKKTKAYHMIFSFSEKDFQLTKDKTELTKQAMQAGKLVQGFLRKDLSKDAQFVLGVQRDSKGHMLHVHVALNSVKLSGKVLNTNGIRLLDKGKQLGLRSRMDKYLEENFEKVTGRSYKPVEPQQDNLVKSTEWHVKDREGAKNDVKQAYSWKEHLKSLIYDAFSASHDLASFKDACKQNGVQIKTRRASVGKDATGKKLYRNAYTYSFIGEDCKNHSSRDFAYTRRGGVRGLGKSFTPDALEKEFEYDINRQKQLLQEATTTIRQLTTSSTIKRVTNDFAENLKRRAFENIAVQNGGDRESDRKSDSSTIEDSNSSRSPQTSFQSYSVYFTGGTGKKLRSAGKAPKRLRGKARKARQPSQPTNYNYPNFGQLDIDFQQARNDFNRLKYDFDRTSNAAELRSLWRNIVFDDGTIKELKQLFREYADTQTTSRLRERTKQSSQEHSKNVDRSDDSEPTLDFDL